MVIICVPLWYKSFVIICEEDINASIGVFVEAMDFVVVFVGIVQDNATVIRINGEVPRVTPICFACSILDSELVKFYVILAYLCR